MRRNLSIIIAISIMIGVIIGLSALSFVKLDQPEESELSPIRTTYNPRPTGIRAFYQLLEETGANVARWRHGFADLATKADKSVLVIVGPFHGDSQPSSAEMRHLQSWVIAGGNLLIVSRDPRGEFADPGLTVISSDEVDWAKSADEIVDPLSDQLIVQPTVLTRNLKGLQFSKLASRIRIVPPRPQPSVSPSPAPSPTPLGEEEEIDYLSSPVVHLGDRHGAVLADFEIGEGRIAILTDPFVIANNGIARGANLTLALNLMTDLAGGERRIYFDEAHHGFREARNELFTYFRGTPAPWVLAQGILIAIVLAYTFGKRFARPLPLPQVDRHSPLEFVGSMANLQKVAAARDLALENIYPKFRAHLCQTLGLSVRAEIDDIAEAFERRRTRMPGRFDVTADELRKMLREAEGVLAGAPVVDAELVRIVAIVRRVEEGLKPLKRG